MFQSHAQPAISEKNETIIGALAKLTGNLASEGDMRFDGCLEKGEIDVKGLLTIGAGANVKGNIKAVNLKVAGTLEGNAQVSQNIEIDTTGKIKGDIFLNGHLIITAGGILNGKSQMGEASKDAELKKNKVKI